MRSPQSVLENLQKHSLQEGYQYERLYRNLYNPQFYLLAYQNLYANKGSLTAGVDGKTLSGVSMERIYRLIDRIRNHSYQPLPARRQYIPKKSGNGLRPLGIPAADDKLVQEVVRMILESIYEPTFANTSHGFRPNRSCHTALSQVQTTFTAVKWFVEGDIKGFFDNIDHHTLIAIIRKRIHDEAFIELLWKLLRAGYMEDWAMCQTYSGTPQGSGVSPLLANIYLNELDQFIARYKASFDKGNRRGHNCEYIRASHNYIRTYHQNEKKWDSMNEDQKREAKRIQMELKKIQQSIPCRNQMDEGYRRIQYVRYADDFIIGINGSKADAQQVKADIGDFLAQKLKLTLSAEKTLITHGHRKARFLGYDITISKDIEPQKTSRGMIRSLNGRVNLIVPKDKWVGKLLEYGILQIQSDENGKERWMPKARNVFLNKEPIDILSLYNAEIRGIYNYYRMARNVSVLNKFSYVMEYSMYKTLAGKLRTNIAGIKRKYMQNGVFGIEYTTRQGVKRAKFFHGGFKRDKRPIKWDIDTLPDYRHEARPRELLARFLSGSCELCHHSGSPVTVYQVKSLKGLQGHTEVEKRMLKMRRRTIILCKECYDAIASENVDHG